MRATPLPQNPQSRHHQKVHPEFDSDSGHKGPPIASMSSAPKDDSHPAVKGPSALRSILAGSTAGAVEIGEVSHCACVVGSANFLSPCSSHHISSRVYVAVPEPIPLLLELRYLTARADSCQNKNTAQSQVSCRTETAMATIRQAVVCWVHHSHYRQLAQGGNSYDGPHARLREPRTGANQPPQDSLHSTSTRRCCVIPRESSLVRGPSLRVSALVSQSRSSRSRRRRVSKQHCKFSSNTLHRLV